MKAHHDLPEWVWRLVEALEQYEGEHPKLFRESWQRDGYDPYPCFGPQFKAIVPADVRDAAELMRRRRTRAGESA